jgi:hypothetical protein
MEQGSVLDKVRYFQKWVNEADPKTLQNLWLMKYGHEWIPDSDLADGFNDVAVKLCDHRMIDVHRPAPLSSTPMCFRIPEEADLSCK